MTMGTLPKNIPDINENIAVSVARKPSTQKRALLCCRPRGHGFEMWGGFRV